MCIHYHASDLEYLVESSSRVFLNEMPLIDSRDDFHCYSLMQAVEAKIF